MLRTLLVSVCLGGLALGAAACDSSSKSAPAPSAADRAAAKAKVGTMTVEQLAALLGEGKARPVDANRDTVRSREGVIPGATLLSNSEKYDVSELPADKQTTLVFYCANTQCGAGESAAERAVIAGYLDVHVLPAGIAGWKQAGQQTESI